MSKIVDKMIDHPISSWFIIGTVASAITSIIRAIKGTNSQPISINFIDGDKTESNEEESE